MTDGHSKVLRTSSREEAQALGAEVFYPHRLDRLPGAALDFSVVMRVVRAGPLTIGNLRYGTDASITIDGGELATSYHVNIPLAGDLESRYAGIDVTATPARAAVYGPSGEVVLRRWARDVSCLCVKIDRHAFERELETMLGRVVAGPIAVDPVIDLRSGPARLWHDQVRILAHEAHRADGPTAAVEAMARNVTACLLLSVGHQYRADLWAPPVACRPQAVRQAVELIEDAPERPLSVGMLAAECHVSVRALQAGFQREVGMSPMAYLRHVRLRRAHEALATSAPDETTVAAVAYRWGFSSPSRFAGAYRNTFGVLPSTTLRHGPRR